jgi:Raf kinase inhibitor-like YbhB/YbcL family protein
MVILPEVCEFVKEGASLRAILEAASSRNLGLFLAPGTRLDWNNQMWGEVTMSRHARNVPWRPCHRWLYSLALLAWGCGGGQLPPEVPGRLTIQLKSPAFTEGGMIPKEYTCDGADTSPPLEWSAIPESARALVLVCDDPDAPTGTWSHWVVLDLHPETRSLAAGIGAVPTQGAEPKAVAGASMPSIHQGKNDFGKIGYGGPCPPSGTHRYFFRLYALDRPTELPVASTRAAALKAIEEHILAEGRLMGRYSRSG